MKNSKSYLPRKVLALMLSFALAASWVIPSSVAVYADDSEDIQQEDVADANEILSEDTEDASGSVDEGNVETEEEAIFETDNFEADNEVSEEVPAEESADGTDETTEEPVAFSYNSGSGTAEDPGVISDAATLKAFAEEVDAGNHVSDYVKLGADIDLSGIENWNPIGLEDGRKNLFAGNFDGAGYTVSNMKISSYDSSLMNQDIGLFSTLAGGAKVNDLKVENASITGEIPSGSMNARVGVLSGWSLSGATVVDNVVASGVVDVKSNGTSTYAGGIIGNAVTGVSIVNSVSGVNVSLTESGDSWAIFAGGITASAGNSSVVANDAVTGNVSLTSEKKAGVIGGVVGMAAGIVANTYSSGSVSYSGTESEYTGALIGQFTNGTGALAAEDLYYASDATNLDAAGTVEPSDITVDGNAMVQADMAGEAFADTMNTNLKKAYRTLGGSAVLKQWVAADGKVVPAGDDYEYVEEMSSTTIGGATYFYADTEGALDGAVYKAVVKSRKGETVYTFSKSDLTQVGDTSYYYAVQAGSDPLTGTLYGYGEGKAATYKSVYADLGVEADDSYDAITSATKFTGHHAKDIPSLVTYGTNEAGEKYINGLTLGRSAVQVEATPYVEANILKAAGETLTSEQEALLDVTLKVNPMNAPSEETVPLAVKSAEWTTSRYGIGEFAIVPDDTVPGYVWSEYWGSVYAATVSNGTTTVGAVHWIDLYGEAATSGPHYNKVQLALNNGTSVASNEAEVNRYAAFFDSSNNLKPGKYTINIYAEGYETLTAEVTIPCYVLMNIPYDKFYEAEGVSDVDAVTSATVKTYNQNMAGGSYHSGSLNVTDPDTDDPLSGAKILGITYPVLVEDLSVLTESPEVTDDSAATITVASGKSTRTTKEVTGADVLFASGDYAYYVMSGEPANFKVLKVGEDGSFSFSAVNKGAEPKEITSAEVTYGGHYTPVNLTVEAPEISDEAVVSAIILATEDGAKYALRHVENIWRKTSLGWYWGDLDGKGLAEKTITSITYYTKDGGVYSYDINAKIKKHSEAEFKARFKDANTIALTGLPGDIENPVATVSSVVGRGQQPVVIAENVSVVDGKIATTDAAVEDTSYTVKVVSDNYADMSATDKYLTLDYAKDAVEKAQENVKAAATDEEKLAAYEELAKAYANLTEAMTKAVEDATQEAAEAKVVDITNYAVKLEGKDSYSSTYTGKEIAPAVTVSGVDAANYDVTYSDNTNAGTAVVTVTAKGDGYKGEITKEFTIAKAANGLTAKASAKSVKLAKVKKKAQTVKPITVSKQQGKVTYKKASGSAKLTVNASTGKVTVKKGTKKGTYKAVVSVTAAGDANHKAKTVKVTVTVKVK